MKAVEAIIVGAFVLYAVIYLVRYIRASVLGKRRGCGCGTGGGCTKEESPTEK